MIPMARLSDEQIRDVSAAFEIFVGLGCMGTLSAQKSCHVAHLLGFSVAAHILERFGGDDGRLDVHQFVAAISMLSADTFNYPRSHQVFELLKPGLQHPTVGIDDIVRALSAIRPDGQCPSWLGPAAQNMLAEYIDESTDGAGLSLEDLHKFLQSNE
eukprot:COSAG05_NODE_522_length_9020_cov_18.531891_6_plen_157_part_00